MCLIGSDISEYTLGFLKLSNFFKDAFVNFSEIFVYLLTLSDKASFFSFPQQEVQLAPSAFALVIIFIKFVLLEKVSLRFQEFTVQLLKLI